GSGIEGASRRASVRIWSCSTPSAFATRRRTRSRGAIPTASWRFGAAAGRGGVSGGGRGGGPAGGGRGAAGGARRRGCAGGRRGGERRRGVRAECRGGRREGASRRCAGDRRRRGVPRTFRARGHGQRRAGRVAGGAEGPVAAPRRARIAARGDQDPAGPRGV